MINITFNTSDIKQHSTTNRLIVSNWNFEEKGSFYKDFLLHGIEEQHLPFIKLLVIKKGKVNVEGLHYSSSVTFYKKSSIFFGRIFVSCINDFAPKADIYLCFDASNKHYEARSGISGGDIL